MKRISKKELDEICIQKGEGNYLLPYHWDLYNFIKKSTQDGKELTVKDICDKFPETYHLNAKECNHTNCPSLYEDIDYINGSPRIEKIIIKNSNSFKLGTEEECEKYALNLQKRALRLLKKYWIIHDKMSTDGQMKLISNAGKAIDSDSKARRFRETFVNK